MDTADSHMTGRRGGGTPTSWLADTGPPPGHLQLMGLGLTILYFVFNILESVMRNSFRETIETR